MNDLYNYHNYEEAYYHMQWYKCKEIGLYLLSKLSDERSKLLYDKLLKFEYDWLHPDTKNGKILSEVKIWIMVNDNYF